MFKDIKEGETHHDKDACYKCSKCGSHFLKEQDKKDCEQIHLDYFSIQQ